LAIQKVDVVAVSEPQEKVVANMDDPFFGKLDPKKHKFTLEQLKQKPEGICHS